jgi:hypothetical protein
MHLALGEQEKGGAMPNYPSDPNYPDDPRLQKEPGHPNDPRLATDNWELGNVLTFIVAVVAVVGLAFFVATISGNDNPVTTAKAPQTNSGPSDSSSPQQKPTPAPSPNQ